MDCGGVVVPVPEHIICIEPLEGVAVPIERIAVPIECVISIDESVEDVKASKTTETEKRAENYAECRICQEEDCINNMESSCGCSGSIKYAHSECIQRWCDHKGDTVCEICNQTYQNEYHVKPLPQSDRVRAILIDPFGIGSDPLDWTPPIQRDSLARHMCLWSLAGGLVLGLVGLTMLAVMQIVAILRQLLTAADDLNRYALFVDLFLFVVAAACGLLLMYFYIKARTLELQLHGRRWRFQGTWRFRRSGGSFNQVTAVVEVESTENS